MKMDNKIAVGRRMAAFRLRRLANASEARFPGFIHSTHDPIARAGPTAFARAQVRAAASDSRRRRPTLPRCYWPLLQARLKQTRATRRIVLAGGPQGEGEGTRHLGFLNPGEQVSAFRFVLAINACSRY